MTFWFVVGTAAELIKMLPVIDEADRRGIDWYLLSSGQSGVNLWRQYSDFRLPPEKIVRLVKTDNDLSSSWMALKWFLRSLLRTKRGLKRKISAAAGKEPRAGDLWFVHGDTLTTLQGAVHGRRLGLKIVHVEAGMRSHDIFNPFPEEINRRLVSKMASYHMAPDENAVRNLALEKIYENVVMTHGNTVLDALDVALKRFEPTQIPSGDYAVANIHRFENLNSATRWNKMIDVLVQTAKQIPLYLVMMPNTIAKLEEDQASRTRLESAGVKMMKRLPFSEFVHFMHKAKFLVSDGGSNQQEAFHFGLPCLILREKTESIEGLGGCCVLSRFDDTIIQDFLRQPEAYRRPPANPEKRPTDIIFSALL